jgi:hypothetical protein
MAARVAITIRGSSAYAAALDELLFADLKNYFGAEDLGKSGETE